MDPKQGNFHNKMTASERYWNQARRNVNSRAWYIYCQPAFWILVL